MLSCAKCGTQIEGSGKFCPSCGTATPNRLTTDSLSVTADQKDVADNKFMAYFAYILVLVPLLVERNSKFVRYHTNQGLVLAIIGVIYMIAMRILSSVLFTISWRLALSGAGIFGLLGWAFAAWSIIGIIHVYKGETKPLPLIGGIQILH